MEGQTQVPATAPEVPAVAAGVGGVGPGGGGAGVGRPGGGRRSGPPRPEPGGHMVARPALPAQMAGPHGAHFPAFAAGYGHFMQGYVHAISL